MGIIACKYFDTLGFVGFRVKERDSKPTVYIRNSSFGGIERIYLWDNILRYSEGMNERGITIISNNFISEKAANMYSMKFHSRANIQRKPRQLENITNNIQIRKALFSTTVDEALAILIEFEATGISVIFDSARCVLLRSMYTGAEYSYTVTEVSKDDVLLQVLPVAASRDLKELERQLRLCRFHDDFFKYVVPELRNETTAYEAMLVPSKKTIQYRAVNCSTVFSAMSNTSEENKLSLCIERKVLDVPFQLFDLYK